MSEWLLKPINARARICVDIRYCSYIVSCSFVYNLFFNETRGKCRDKWVAISIWYMPLCFIWKLKNKTMCLPLFWPQPFGETWTMTLKSRLTFVRVQPHTHPINKHNMRTLRIFPLFVEMIQENYPKKTSLVVKRCRVYNALRKLFGFVFKTKTFLLYEKQIANI